MTAIANIREGKADTGSDCFRAVAAGEEAQAIGNTPGEALDALTAQLGGATGETLLIVQSMQPDCYFSAEQIRRLQFLMHRSHEAVEGTGPLLTLREEAERNALIEAELLGSAARASALADALGR